MRAALFSWGCNYALILFPRFILPASLPELALVLGVPRIRIVWNCIGELTLPTLEQVEKTA